MRIFLSLTLCLCASVVNLFAAFDLRDPAFIGSLTVNCGCPPVAGYTVWFDPSDASTVFTNYSMTVSAAVNTEKVRVMLNKAGTLTNYLRWGELETAPSYATGVSPTGLPMIRNAGGAASYTTNTSTIGLTNGSEGVTVFIVGRPNYNAIVDEQFPTLWSFPGWGFFLQATTPNLFAFVIPAPGPNGSFGAVKWTNANTYAWAVRLRTNTFQAYTGLTPHSQSSWGPRDIASGANRVDLGDVGGAEVFNLSWRGDYGEFIAYPFPLTSLQITNVQNYLISKWGAKLAP